MAIFLAYLVPPSILFIPLATMVFAYGIFDTSLALILTYPTFLIPFCTWLLMGYFRSIPYELEECALIDGASRLQILVKILLPLSVPGLISAGIFAFTLSWNEFIYALTFISASENKTVPVGVITELVEGDVYHWGALMAGALMGSLPVAILYSFFVLELDRAWWLDHSSGGRGRLPLGRAQGRCSHGVAAGRAPLFLRCRARRGFDDRGGEGIGGHPSSSLHRACRPAPARPPRRFSAAL